jgi:MIP family channel proteins
MGRKALAEAIGTFALCFVGILAISGVAIAHAPAGTTSLVGVALAHGLTIAVMVAALGAVSGGHFNPAVTFAFVVTRRLDVRSGAIYWASQIAGATVAGVLLVVLFSKSVVAGGTPDLAAPVHAGAGIVIEAVTTALLVLVVFGTAVDGRAPKSVFPLAIGFTVALDILATGPLTGAAMNPARVLGPAIASGHWAHHLVYWVGPLAGGALAALLHKFVLAEPAVEAEPVAELRRAA